MDDFAKAVFLSELKTQAAMSINAASGLDSVVRRLAEAHHNPALNREILHAEHFRAIHSLLTHLSNVSRLIWPPAYKSRRCDCGKPKLNGKKCGHCLARDRAQFIRDALEIADDDAHILESRTLRDHLEHFDERLDAWLATSKNRNMVQDYIGPPNGIVGLDDSDRMRQYNPQDGVFTFRGESFSLVELVAGVRDIQARVEPVLAELHKWPYPKAFGNF